MRISGPGGRPPSPRIHPRATLADLVTPVAIQNCRASLLSEGFSGHEPTFESISVGRRLTIAEMLFRNGRMLHGHPPRGSLREVETDAFIRGPLLRSRAAASPMLILKTSQEAVLPLANELNRALLRCHSCVHRSRRSIQNVN